MTTPLAANVRNLHAEYDRILFQSVQQPPAATITFLLAEIRQILSHRDEVEREAARTEYDRIANQSANRPPEVTITYLLAEIREILSRRDEAAEKDKEAAANSRKRIRSEEGNEKEDQDCRSRLATTEEALKEAQADLAECRTRKAETEEGLATAFQAQLEGSQSDTVSQRGFDSPPSSPKSSKPQSPTTTLQQCQARITELEQEISLILDPRTERATRRSLQKEISSLKAERDTLKQKFYEHRKNNGRALLQAGFRIEELEEDLAVTNILLENNLDLTKCAEKVLQLERTLAIQFDREQKVREKNEECKTRIESLKEENERLQTVTSSLRPLPQDQEDSQLQNEISRLQATVTDNSWSLQAANESITLRQSLVTDLERQLAAANNALATTDPTQRLTDELQRANSAINHFVAKIQRLRDELQYSNNNCTNLRRQLDTCNGLIAGNVPLQLANERGDRLQRLRGEAEARVVELQAVNEALTTQLKKREDVTKSDCRLWDLVNKANRKVDECRARESGLRDQISVFNRMLEKLKEEVGGKS